MKKLKIDKNSLQFRSIVFACICSFIVLFLIFYVIFPKQKAVAALGQKIKDIQLQVDIQKTLQPIHTMLKSEMNRRESKELPFPEKSKLSRENTDEVFTVVREIATKINMEVLSIVPELSALGEGSSYLLVYIVVRGDFFKFRKFLIGLGGLSYFEHMESLDIEQTSMAKEFKLNIWIALS